MLTGFAKNVLLPAGLAIGLALTSAATEPEYKAYQSPSTRTEYFQIAFNSRVMDISIPGDGKRDSWRFWLSDMEQSDGAVFFGDKMVFDADGMWLGETLYPIDDIYDIRISSRDKLTVITAFKYTGDRDRLSRTRRGNRVEYDRRVFVDVDEFVRGAIFTVLGDITVDGEVNRDIATIFGDIVVGSEAVVRGDMASIEGEIDLNRHSSVYGDVYGGKHKRARRRGRFYRRDEQHVLTAGMVYNRVDGARPWIRYRFDDGDSVLPRLEVEGGYAFAAESWRFNLGLEHTITRRFPIVIGGSFYRRLATEDEWLIGTNENTGFALLFTEDYRDYYQADGASAYLRMRPIKHLMLEGRYRYEETDWLGAHRNLWSLFGGDKMFSRNFDLVESVFRERGILEIDTSTNAALQFMVDYDTRDPDDPFGPSAIAASAALEWSNPDIESDFDYRRYTVSLRRYQRLNRRTMLLFRFIYGGSDGYLPMHKRFYLGGLGTLHGFTHKELMGTTFAMTNVEYRFDFPRNSLALSLMYDAAQIANEQSLDEDMAIKHSVGVALYLGDDTRVSLAKRLDRSEDDDPRLYARFSHNF